MILDQFWTSWTIKIAGLEMRDVKIWCYQNDRKWYGIDYSQMLFPVNQSFFLKDSFLDNDCFRHNPYTFWRDSLGACIYAQKTDVALAYLSMVKHNYNLTHILLHLALLLLSCRIDKKYKMMLCLQLVCARHHLHDQGKQKGMMCLRFFHAPLLYSRFVDNYFRSESTEKRLVIVVYIQLSRWGKGTMEAWKGGLGEGGQRGLEDRHVSSKSPWRVWDW